MVGSSRREGAWHSFCGMEMGGYHSRVLVTSCVGLETEAWVKGQEMGSHQVLIWRLQPLSHMGSLRVLAHSRWDTPGMEIATGLDHTLFLVYFQGLLHLFIQEILIEVLLCARYCAKCWLTEGEQTQDMLPPFLKPTV